ncbi:hypothetical protein KY284_000671 [Solanum tuberosum]|nr:hypothetical protein KY284_000671 [Solanum tuberosum]
MGGIGGVIRDSYGNWVIGFIKIIYAYSPVMAGLQALHTGLTLALEKQTLPIEVEIDSTEVIELFQYAHPNFQSTIESCMSLLKKLGNPVVHHNFRQGNRLADFLAKEGSILSMNNNSPILAATPADARSILQADKDGVAITRRMSLATCSKLSMLGNLNVLFDVSSSDANIIAHRAPNIIATDSNANIVCTLLLIIFILNK